MSFVCNGYLILHTQKEECGGDEGRPGDATDVARRSTTNVTFQTRYRHAFTRRVKPSARLLTRLNLNHFFHPAQYTMNNFFQVKSTGKKSSGKERAEEDLNNQPWVEK